MYKLPLFIFLFFCGSLFAQQQKRPKDETLTRILFVFDGSQSMHARWESGRKIDIAQKMMIQMLDSLQSLKSSSFQVALRVYGHQKPVPPQDCNDTKLEVSFDFNNFSQIKRTIRGLRPKGTTPIARSLLRAASDFPDCEKCRNIIILITDGVEACDEDPCAASRMLQKNGIALKPFVIGVGLDKEFRQTFDCVGTYYDAADERTFKEVLGVVISQALDNTTAQVNLLDHNKLPSETDVAMTFYNRTSGKISRQLVHTINSYGNPDTIYLDPLVTYDLTVHSLPEVKKDSIRISSGTHNIIGLDLPRGSLELKIGARQDPVKCIVRRSGENRILHVQEFNTSQKYLSGAYDLEILTLPRYIKDKVMIEGGQTTTLSVPPPGVVNFSSTSPGYGSILVENGSDWDWVVDLNSEQSRQSFNLQPGNYRVIFRSKTSRLSEYSVSQHFSVGSGATTMVKLN